LDFDDFSVFSVLKVIRLAESDIFPHVTFDLSQNTFEHCFFTISLYSPNGVISLIIIQ